MENYKIVSVDEWNNQHDDYVYHYTDFNSAISILKHNILFTSQARIPRFGRGVFMTKHSPNKSDYELIQNNYQGNWKYASKVECAFAFVSAYLDAKKFRDYRDFNRDLWKHDENIFLNTVEFTLILRKEQHLYLITVKKPEPKRLLEPIYLPISSPESGNEEILSQTEKSVEKKSKKSFFTNCLII